MTACNWTSTTTIECNSPNLTINKMLAKHKWMYSGVLCRFIDVSCRQRSIFAECKPPTITRISMQWTQRTIRRHIVTVHCERIQRHSLHLPHQITPIQRPGNSCSERTRTLSFVHIFTVLSMQVSTKMKSTKIGVLNRSLHTFGIYCCTFLLFYQHHHPTFSEILFPGSGIIY